MPFAARLRALRERAGLTQEELAERAGLTPHAVSALERGARTRPYPHTVRQLAAALGVGEEERALLVASVPSRRGPRAVPGRRARPARSRRGAPTAPARPRLRRLPPAVARPHRPRRASSSRPPRCTAATPTSPRSCASSATGPGW